MLRKPCSATTNRVKGGRLTSTLVLALVCGQASAASGVSLCEGNNSESLQISIQASLSESILTDEIDTLTIDFIEHGDAAKLAATSREDLDAKDAELDDVLSSELSYNVPIAPRVSAILRRIFDESVTADADSTDEDLATGSPLAELKAPSHRHIPEEFSKPLTSEPSVREVSTPAAETRLPGIEEDEERRFRRQMFRTDI